MQQFQTNRTIKDVSVSLQVLWLCGPIIQWFTCFLWIPCQLPITLYFLFFNHLFVFFEFLFSYKLFFSFLVISLSVLCRVPCPVFCLGSVSAPCHWFLSLGNVGVAFIERRLSLLILFIISLIYFISWRPIVFTSKFDSVCKMRCWCTRIFYFSVIS
jgi:hypothetical protein